MANWFEPTDVQRETYAQWLSQRPEPIRVASLRYGLAPWVLFRMKSTGQVVSIHSLSESGEGAGKPPVTVTVHVLRDPRLAGLMAGLEGTGVFGVDPEDLEAFEPETPEVLTALARRAAGDTVGTA